MPGVHESPPINVAHPMSPAGWACAGLFWMIPRRALRGRGIHAARPDALSGLAANPSLGEKQVGCSRRREPMAAPSASPNPNAAANRGRSALGRALRRTRTGGHADGYSNRSAIAARPARNTPSDTVSTVASASAGATSNSAFQTTRLLPSSVTGSTSMVAS